MRNQTRFVTFMFTSAVVKPLVWFELNASSAVCVNLRLNRYPVLKIWVGTRAEQANTNYLPSFFVISYYRGIATRSIVQSTKPYICEKTGCRH